MQDPIPIQETPITRPQSMLTDSISRLSQMREHGSPLIRLNADAIIDAHYGIIESGSILVKHHPHGLQVIQAGTHQSIDDLQIDEQVIELTLNNRVLIPGLVNAHTHLDLTHIGPAPHSPVEGFVRWVDMIRTNRAQTDDQIINAVNQGINASLLGGTIAVGDIAGAPSGRLSDAPARTLSESPLIGVSFIEFFGIGSTSSLAIEKVNTYLNNQFEHTSKLIEGKQVRIGLQPHAPNTVDLNVYLEIQSLAIGLGIPLSTHLAETKEENEFIKSGSGPQREMLERFGIWNNDILVRIAQGQHPVEHLLPVLTKSPVLVAHVNDATDNAIEKLLSTQTSVAYCPRGSEYFGAHNIFGNHRYQEMLSAGINVCLGTDSIVNLPTPDRISILDEIRFLWHRDHTDPRTLIEMGTTNGAHALGLDPEGFTFESGALLKGLLAIPRAESSGSSQDIWESIMHDNRAPEWVFLHMK